MNTPVVQYVGNRNPALSDTITSGGVAQNINGKTLTFKMRSITSSTLKVNAAATNLDVDSSTRGQWSYAWAAADVDTAGFYLGWVEVAGGGLTQDVPEFLIQFVAHTPGTNLYVEVEDLKNTLAMSGTTFANRDIENAILAASRAVDEFCFRRFYADTDAAQVRYYTPDSAYLLRLDDLVTLTSMQVDQDGDGTFEETWTANTDFVLEPFNAAADGYPYTQACVHPLRATTGWPAGYPRSVKVTGKFGWSSTPRPVSEATTIIAAQLLRRKREAPFGVVALGLDGEAVRISRADPHVALLLGPYVRYRP